ncbi:hypothetical protein [Streptomyces sp. NPDC048720]|uniref:hypothetical protein n=1 Tax=Streptomyces sp. NPDC048720 TaxID=3365588 RepID=UPI00371E3682
MSKVVLMTGASSGFGALTARALADAGHRVYAGIRQGESAGAYPALRFALDPGTNASVIRVLLRSGPFGR